MRFSVRVRVIYTLENELSEKDPCRSQCVNLKLMKMTTPIPTDKPYDLRANRDGRGINSPIQRGAKELSALAASLDISDRPTRRTRKVSVAEGAAAPGLA